VGGRQKQGLLVTGTETNPMGSNNHIAKTTPLGIGSLAGCGS